MPEQTFKIKVSNQYQYLQLLNGIFRLTEMELRVLALFAEEQHAITTNNLPLNAFSPDVKKRVADKLNKDDFNTLNNYIKRLKDKKVIKEIEGGYQIPDRFILGDTTKVIFKIK